MGSPEHIWILISRKLTGEASETELRELQEFIDKNPGIQPFMEMVTSMWKPGVKNNMSEAEQAFSKHMKRMEDMSQKEQAEPKPIWQNESVVRNSRFRFFNSGVLGNYFKVIYRNLYRFKSFTVINITGLAIGMASAILILLLVQNELSYDQFHEKKDRIYELINRGMLNGHMEIFGTPSVLATVLKTEYPQVEEVTRLNGTGPIVLSANDKQIEGKGMMVDSGFLRIFSYPTFKRKPGNGIKLSSFCRADRILCQKILCRR